ncbi:MAG: TrkH family potassium uptake protein [Candidatus Gastranaerophilales bacterium]|nr:TrkH family potassium uptake protein [Candidatus Gastranaerophilales bacterium]
MRTSHILIAISLVLKYIALVILAPCLVALYYKDYYSLIPFIMASFSSYTIGVFCNPKKVDGNKLNDLKKSEALFIVALSWIIFGVVSAVPYLFYNISPLNALFEAVSGITTTGATILSDFSLYPKTMFFWRSMSQWLGGMGIIVLFIAILPQFAVAGRQMFFAEAPGPTEDKFTPRIRHTATALWKIYIILTILEIVILKLCGMPWFDSFCNSFSTLAAGGFSPNPKSIWGYNCPIYVWVISLFMFLSGANFALQYKIITKRKPMSLFKDEEFNWYSVIVLGFACVIALILFLNHEYGFVASFRESLFQVISIITTTGFASADFNLWAFSAKAFLFVLMFVGGCAGSAGGGVKVVRLVFIFKYIKRQITQIHHPNGVYPIRINKVSISSEIVKQLLGFVIFYYLIFAVSAFVTSIIEHNLIIGMTGAITTLGNIGPGFGLIGPMGSFVVLSPLTKIIYIINMLVGRLELIPFLALLHPDFWTNVKR